VCRWLFDTPETVMTDSSLVQRLKERKLVQWALAYLAGGFVVFQAVEVLAEPWNISTGIQRGVHILLAFGLLITLVLAWYHGERGRQRVSGPELLMLTTILIVAGMVLSVLAGGEESGPAAFASPNDNRPSIAVLPLDNNSPDPQDAYFANAVQGDLISALRRISSISVKGESSVERYRENRPSVREMATALGVDFLLEGAAQIVGSVVRVTVRLLDGRSDEIVWEGEWQTEYQPEEAIRIQGEVAHAVATWLRIEITPVEEAQIAEVPTDNRDAFRAFQMGRTYLRQLAEENFRRAIQSFSRALELDSSFAPAYAGLGEAYAWLGMANIDPPSEIWPQAREATGRALALDESLPTAHMVLALEEMLYQHDWQGAEGGFRRALELDPDRADVRLLFSWLLAVLHRNEEALAQARLAQALEPHSPWVDMMRCWTFQMVGQLEEALAIAQGLIDLQPPVPQGNLLLAQTYIEQGSFEAALGPLQDFMIFQGEDINDELAWAAMVSGLLGRDEEARTYSERFEALGEGGRWVSPVQKAWIAIGLGDIEGAIDWLEEGRQGKDFWIPFVVSFQYYSPGVRGHPRFQNLQRAMGLD
jgi:TolB-like protein/Tfp pilus assembly protein PilF